MTPVVVLAAGDKTMLWSIRDAMSLREEFVTLARQEGANRRELCRRFGISAQTGYKWLARFAQQGAAGLADRSRSPLHSPAATQSSLQQAALALRREHPAWGGRKIARRLQDLGLGSLAPSTVTAILHRHGLITPEASQAAQPWQRFEHERPNALWQIDFKGYVDTPGGRCHPLTLLDDHSRFNMALRACASQEGVCVREHAHHRVSHLWPAGTHQCRQRRALGCATRAWAGHCADAVADTAGYPGEFQPPLPPADQWQGRAVSPLTQGRGAQWPVICGSDPGTSGVRPLARDLQPPAAPSGTGHGHPGQPLPDE